MANIKISGVSLQNKIEFVRRTRGRNYSASLRLEGFTVTTARNTTVSASHKDEVIAKYKQLAY